MKKTQKLQNTQIEKETMTTELKIDNTNIETYLGKMGYTIKKKYLTEKEIEDVKEELTAKPITTIKLSTNNQVSYPVYRESDTKLYVPRFYGIKKIGIYNSVKIPEGDDINIEFTGTLRPVQIPIINAYINSIKHQENINGFRGGGGLIEAGCGVGKTIISLKIVDILKKKTIIIVHKEFLVNQWMERIQQFLPNARVGKIQGQIVDIDEKDIVIAMLKSLSIKEYPDETFTSFGFMIVDETHHISSEVFCRSLFKVIVRYTLGLSATMTRKDGLTYIFKMFLGEIVYKFVNKETHNVEVRKINYSTTNEDFNEVITDFRGNIQYSTMIVKLCNFNHRSEFIIKILTQTLKENEDTQQIMLLCHNRNLIDYFYNAIEHRNIASVGKYVGGMKQDKLKESENKKIIVATYSMASEALDIPTLTTLFLCTPKTDIEQSIGRILRAKHTNPIVVDIVDPHAIFQRQYEKREKFYQKNKYKIVEYDFDDAFVN